MSVALHGNLRDFGIGEVFQLVGQQQKTGVLEVANPEQRIRISFDRGAVAWGEAVGPYEHAALGDLLVRGGLVTPERMLALERAVQDGEGDLIALLQKRADLGERQLQQSIDQLTQDTVFELLRWTEGSFHFTAQPVKGEGDSAHGVPAEQILMDGLRMLDEWRTFDADAREVATIWKRADGFDVFREQAAGESPERIALAGRIFALVDGRASARRIIDLARKGEFEGVYWLSRLRRAGVIAPLAREAAQRRGRRVLALGAGRSLVASLRAVAPFAALGVLVVGLVLASDRQAPNAGEAAALERSGAQAFRRAALRNAVEAYRFARGEWPADLAAVGEALPLPMASDEVHPYYFARRGDNFVVLLPEE
jgi:hypothetical protein